MKTNRRNVVGGLFVAVGSALLPQRSSVAAAAPASEPTTSGAEKVVGIGGVFFRAHDPKTLARWYQDHLGVSITPESSSDPVWQQQAGPTVFAPFADKTTYFGDMGKQWMINFRVRDLGKMAAQLEAAGIAVKVYPADPSGRFARIHDPEGNPIELWQPMETRTR